MTRADARRAEAGVFTLPQAAREAALFPELAALTEHHRARSAEYSRILHALGHPEGELGSHLRDLPWLPARLFKIMALKSIPDDSVFRVLTSSGTTGTTSQVYLDHAAAAAQQQALTRTLRTLLGPNRLPMLIVDTRAAALGRTALSARGAAALGVMTYGRDHTFVLGEDGKADLPAVRRFTASHGDRPFVVFGLTYLVWSVLTALGETGEFDLGNGVLLHTGGWKRMADQGIGADVFRQAIHRTGLRRIHNFYGMVEQIGTIFPEGTRTRQLYCPDFAEIIVRDPETWREAETGRPGLIEVLSTLPRSYPGHVLLTEDIGVIHGIDDGDWPGKRFSILGRLPRAETRGCSDTLLHASS